MLPDYAPDDEQDGGQAGDGTPASPGPQVMQVPYADEF